jgi:DNA-binding GntR family transcriptional regulator
MNYAPKEPSETPLQRQLMRAIISHAREAGLHRGDALSQLGLARRLGVSRTPVRAALARLSELGVVDLSEGGARIADLEAGPQLADNDEPDSIEGLMAAIARDRHEGRIGEEVSESDLMRRHERSRGEVVEALRRMGDLSLVRRKPGFGWRFEAPMDAASKRESYRFRLLIEPAALIEPGYHADPAWLAHSRKQHLHYRNRRWRPEHAIGFFEMNADFHRQLVAFSGNRWMVQAIEQQNALRRLRNWSWRLDDDRVAQSCDDHLAVLEALIAHDTSSASSALRRHIETTMESVG